MHTQIESLSDNQTLRIDRIGELLTKKLIAASSSGRRLKTRRGAKTTVLPQRLLPQRLLPPSPVLDSNARILCLLLRDC